LLFIIGYAPLFTFVRQFFEISFRETFRHWCFLIVGGALLILSGLLFTTIASPRTSRLKPGAAIMLTGVLVLILGLIQFSPRAPSEDNLVVAIAGFTPISAEAEGDAKNIPHRIEGKLREKQLAGAPLKIRRLDAQVNGPDAEARRRAAIALGTSKKGNAHIVIWGEVRKEDGELYVYPCLTICRKLQKTPIQEDPTGLIISETVSSGPNHLGFKKRLTSEIAEIVLMAYGLAYYRTGDWDKTISILEHVDTPEACLMTGVAHLAKGEYQKSLAPLKKAVGQPQISVPAYNNLAIAYLHLGQLDDARSYLEKSLDFTPHNPDILSNYALIQLCLGSYQDAADKFEKALAYGDNPITRSNLAFCLFELGKTKAAVDEWEKCLDMLDAWNKSAPMPWDGLDARAGLAVGYFAVGDIDAARNLYEQVLTRNPDYSDSMLLETQFLWPPKARSKASELSRNMGLR
jgi:tetratricopeptide (TPR) repeat protein